MLYFVELGTGNGRSLVKGFVKEIIVMREPVNVHMTGFVIVILEKKNTTTGIGIELGIGSEERTGKEITDVTVIVIVVTEIGTGTVVEKRTVVALTTVIVRGAVRGAGSGTEIMSALVMNETAVTCMRGMLTMPTVDPNMTKICQITDRIMAMGSMSSTKAMSPMAMVKMDVVVKLSTQSGMSMSTIVWTRMVCKVTMLNLMVLKKVRHSRKVIISITRQLNV